MMIGCFLPWVTSTTGFASLSLNGLDMGGDGLLILPAGLLIALVGTLVVSGMAVPMWARASCVVLAVLAGAVWILDYADINDRVEQFSNEVGELGVASVGSGLWLIAFGIGVSTVASLSILRGTFGDQLPFTSITDVIFFFPLRLKVPGVCNLFRRHPAPNPMLLLVLKRVLEALGSHRAPGTHGARSLRGSTALGEEHCVGLRDRELGAFGFELPIDRGKRDHVDQRASARWRGVGF